MIFLILAAQSIPTYISFEEIEDHYSYSVEQKDLILQAMYSVYPKNIFVESIGSSEKKVLKCHKCYKVDTEEKITIDSVRHSFIDGKEFISFRTESFPQNHSRNWKIESINTKKVYFLEVKEKQKRNEPINPDLLYKKECYKNIDCPGNALILDNSKDMQQFLKSVSKKVFKYSLPSGRAITSRDIMTPYIIDRSDLVNIKYNFSGINIISRGIALQKGKKDEIIRFRIKGDNYQKNKVIEAKIISNKEAVYVY